jgi:hypothetical protein
MEEKVGVLTAAQKAPRYRVAAWSTRSLWAAEYLPREHAPGFEDGVDEVRERRGLTFAKLDVLAGNQLERLDEPSKRSFGILEAVDQDCWTLWRARGWSAARLARPLPRPCGVSHRLMEEPAGVNPAGSWRRRLGEVSAFSHGSADQDVDRAG